MKPQYIGGTEARKLEAQTDNIETKIYDFNLEKQKRLGKRELELASEELGTESAGEVVTSELPKPIEDAGHKRPEAAPADDASASGEDSPAEGGATRGGANNEDKTLELLSADGDNDFNFGQVEIAGEKKKGRYEQIEEMAKRRVLTKLNEERSKNRTLTDLFLAVRNQLKINKDTKKLQDIAVGSDEDRRLTSEVARLKEEQRKNAEFMDNAGVIRGVRYVAGIAKAAVNTLKYGMFKPYTAAIAMAKERKNIMENGMFGEEDAAAKTAIANRIVEGGVERGEQAISTSMVQAKIGQGESLTEEENRLLYREQFLRDTLNSVSAGIVNGGMSKEAAMEAFKAAVAKEREKGELNKGFVQRADNFDEVAEKMINKVFDANEKQNLSLGALKKYINGHICLTEGSAKVGPEVKTKVDKTTELLMRGTAAGIAAGTALFAINKLGRAGIKIAVTGAAVAVITGASPLAMLGGTALATSGALGSTVATGAVTAASTKVGRALGGAIYGGIRGAQSAEQMQAARDIERSKTGADAKFDTDFKTAQNVNKINAELTEIFGSAKNPKKFEDLTAGEKEKVAKLYAEITARSDIENARGVNLTNIDSRDADGKKSDKIEQEQKEIFSRLKNLAKKAVDSDDGLKKVYEARKQEYGAEVDKDVADVLKARKLDAFRRTAASAVIGGAVSFGVGEGMSKIRGAVSNPDGALDKIQNAFNRAKDSFGDNDGTAVLDDNAVEVANNGGLTNIHSIDELRGHMNADQFTQAEVVRDADGGKAIYVNMAEDNDLTDGNGGHVMMTQIAGLGDKDGFKLSKDGEVKIGALEKSGFGEGDTADMKVLVDENGDGTADKMMTMSELREAVNSAKEAGQDAPKIWTDAGEDKMVLVQDDGDGELGDGDKVVTIALHAKGNTTSDGGFDHSWDNMDNATQFEVANDTTEVKFGGESQEVHAMVTDGGYDSMDNTHFDVGRERNNFDAPLISGEYDVSNLSTEQYAEAMMNLQKQVITDPHSSSLWWNLLLNKDGGAFSMAEHNNGVNEMIGEWNAGQQDAFFNRTGQALMNLIKGGEVKFMKAGDFEHDGSLMRASFFQADKGDGSVYMGASHDIATSEDDPIMIIKNFVDRDGNGEFDDVNGDGAVDDNDMVNVFMQDEEQIQRIARAAGVPEDAKIIAIGIRGKCGQPEVIYERPHGFLASEEDSEYTTTEVTLTVTEEDEKVPVSDPKKEVTTDEKKSDPTIETTTKVTDDGAGEGTTDENTEGTVTETDGGAGEGTTDENTEGTVIEETDPGNENTGETDPTDELTAKNPEELKENMEDEGLDQRGINEKETPLTEEPENNEGDFNRDTNAFTNEEEVPHVADDGSAIVTDEDVNGGAIVGHEDKIEENPNITISGDESGRTVQGTIDESRHEYDNDINLLDEEAERRAEEEAAQRAAEEAERQAEEAVAANTQATRSFADNTTKQDRGDWWSSIFSGEQ